MNTLTMQFLAPAPKPAKKQVMKSNDILVKVGKHGLWARVTTLIQYDDSSFDICWDQEWTQYDSTATLQIME